MTTPERITELPEAIMKIRKSALRTPRVFPKDFSHVIEYTYPTEWTGGVTFGTSIELVYPKDSSTFPSEGSLIKLHGVLVVANKVSVRMEKFPEHTRIVRWCEVSIAPKER